MRCYGSYHVASRPTVIRTNLIFIYREWSEIGIAMVCDGLLLYYLNTRITSNKCALRTDDTSIYSL